jgi:acyl carrier protein
MRTGENLRDLIEREIRRLLPDADVEPDAAIPDDVLEFELDSMKLARLLGRLEAELGVDPFSELVDLTELRTVADLVRIYEEALRGSG